MNGRPFAMISHTRAQKETLNVVRSGRSLGNRRIKPVQYVQTFKIAGKAPTDAQFLSGRRADHNLTVALEIAAFSYITGSMKHIKMARYNTALWILKYKPSFNPINETRLHKLFVTIDLLGVYSESHGHPFSKSPLITKIGNGYIYHAEQVAGLNDPQKHNNWQAHRIKLAALGAFLSGDEASVARVEAQFKRQIDTCVLKGGVLIDYIQRDAVHYVIFALEPMLMAALAARCHGLDWYSYRNAMGLGLCDALHWLEPYARGDKTNREFAFTKEPYDIARKRAGLLNDSFNPAKARNVMHLASLLDCAFARWRVSEVPLWLQMMPGLKPPLRAHDAVSNIMYGAQFPRSRW